MYWFEAQLRVKAWNIQAYSNHNSIASAVTFSQVIGPANLEMFIPLALNKDI